VIVESEVSSVVMQQSLRNLAAAFTNFFAKRADYPKFKAKH
jgi:putative transposase